MSATIYYQPIKGKYLSIGAPSGFLDLLEKLGFNRGECLIQDTDHFKLEVASNVTENEDYKKALLELAENAYKHGSIRVWVEY